MSTPPKPTIKRIRLAQVDLDDQRYQIRIEARPGQLRRSLEEHGQLVPVVVQPVGDQFRVIDGYRRCTVLRELGEIFIRAAVMEVDDREALRLAFVCNHDRKTLKPEDRWNSVRLMSRRGWKTAEISAALGLHKDTVSRLRNLFPQLELVDAGIAEGWLRPSHLKALRTLVPRAKWPHWLRRIRDEGLSGRRLQEEVSAEDRRREPPFVLKDADGGLIVRGFKFDPNRAVEEEISRAVEQLDDAVDRMRSWLRRRPKGKKK